MMPLPQQILVAAEVCGLFWLMFGFPCVVGACSASNHLRWPLSPEVCTDQVLSNPDLHLRYCPLQFVDDVPILPTPPSLDPHSVNLSAENSLDFRISSAPSGDYGFSVFVKPAEETNSCILHYKSDDGSFEMKFTSTPTESVASVPGFVSCSFKPLLQGQWQKIGMSLDDSNAEIHAFVDVAPFDDYKDDVLSKASFGVLPKFTVPGTLRVGGSFDGEKYKGLVSCIGFVFHKNLDCSTDCYDSSTWSTVNKDHEKRKYGTFVPYATERLPSQSPINVTSAESVSFCALLCLRSYSQCYTVAFNTQTRSCFLFSGFYFAGLISTPNTNLYTLQAY